MAFIKSCFIFTLMIAEAGRSSYFVVISTFFVCFFVLKMASKEMKFLTYKSSNETNELRCYGRPSENENKQSQSLNLSNFLGTWKFENRESWLCSPQTVLKQLQKILDSDDAQVMTKWKDLSKMHLEKLSKPRRALFIKNPQKTYNPRKFFVLLEDVDYCFKQSNWKKYFPPFQSALEAHRNLHVLLGIFYNMYLDKYKDRTNHRTEDLQDNLIKFEVGQLVLVKCMKERKSDGSYSYEVRRGLIENSRLERDKSECIHTVYLLDFGFRLEVSDHFLCPLPRPFNCISPLAIQCSLYGVSPVGEKWCNEAIRHFSELLESHTDSVFLVDIMSNRLLLKPVILNINVCNIETMDKKGQKRKPRIKFEINLTQFMINSQMGSQWNLFPARPKLMAGATPSPEGQKNHPKLLQTAVSYQDALLITNVHIPHLHKRLPRSVIRREFKKLFHLRNFIEIRDMKNCLVVQTIDNNHRLKTPCTLKTLKTSIHSEKDQAVLEEEDHK